MKCDDNYRLLGANVAQQTMRSADQSFKTFFGLLKLAKSGRYESWRIKLPKYLDKDAYYPIKFAQAQITDGKLLVPMSPEMKRATDIRIRISIPKYLIDKKIHQVHIIPKHNAKFFEIRYMFDDIEEDFNYDLDKTKALAIDFGINNFCTCVTNDGNSFIVDGKKLKSINQWYNKELSRLSSIKDKQKIKHCTNLQYAKINKRNNQINDYIYKSAKLIIRYCIDHKIGNLIVGYNDGFQDKVNLGKVNNQKFVMIPYGRMKDRLEYLCNLYGINYQIQEESYTSKASFWDQDEMPKWNPQNPKQCSFSGKRISRGQYQTHDKTVVNADVNGALNILRKSNVVSCEALYSSGDVITPLRIRLTRSNFGGNLNSKLLKN
jgi:IS605 OrfB family transposase